MNERVAKYLVDIRICIKKINSYTKNMTLSVYISDLKTKDAVERNFEIIGEAINKVKKLDEAVFNKITEGQRIIGFRNQLIHGYNMISDPITWDIICQKLPRLQKDIDKLLQPDF
jgi:uncharacterized protein with HEPN domain